MAKAVTSFGAMFSLLLVVGLLGTMMLSVDTDIKHPEAAGIRTRYRKHACEGSEIWFAKSRGTILVLCGMPQSDEWGGLICRVTEKGGTRLLADDAYEVTVFVASRHYWDGVLVRDGYKLAAYYPSVLRFFKEWY